jgi:hypothetical protein
VGIQRNDRQAVVAPDADRCQAEYYHDQLHLQIELLNEQAEVLKVALAKYELCGELGQARRIQRDIRLNAVEHRKLIDMLSALNRRFGGDETEPRLVTSPRHRAAAPPASLNLTTPRRAATAPAS